eukprot:403377078
MQELIITLAKIYEITMKENVQTENSLAKPETFKDEINLLDYHQDKQEYKQIRKAVMRLAKISLIFNKLSYFINTFVYRSDCEVLNKMIKDLFTSDNDQDKSYDDEGIISALEEGEEEKQPSSESDSNSNIYSSISKSAVRVRITQSFMRSNIIRITSQKVFNITKQLKEYHNNLNGIHLYWLNEHFTKNLKIQRYDFNQKQDSKMEQIQQAQNFKRLKYNIELVDYNQALQQKMYKKTIKLQEKLDLKLTCILQALTKNKELRKEYINQVQADNQLDDQDSSSQSHISPHQRSEDKNEFKLGTEFDIQRDLNNESIISQELDLSDREEGEKLGQYSDDTDFDSKSCSFIEQQESDDIEHNKFYEEMTQRLIQDSNRTFNETRQRLNDLLNLQNIGIMEISSYLGSAFEMVIDLFNNSAKRNEVAITRREVSSKFCSYFIAILRCVRGHNFNKQLIDFIEKSLNFLSYNEFLSDKKINFIKDALSICVQKMQVKFANDEKLNKDQELVFEMQRLNELHLGMIKYIQSNKIKSLTAILRRNEENNQFNKSIKSFASSFDKRKQLRHAMVEKEIQSFIENKTVYRGQNIQMKADYYSLTGVGIQFKNSTIKIFLRSEKAGGVATLLEKQYEKKLLEAKLQQQDTKNTEIKYPTLLGSESNFEIRHIKNKHVFYLKMLPRILQNIGFDPWIQENMIVKVNVNDYNMQKEYKVAQLLRQYCLLNQGMYKNLAAFWIFIIKLNMVQGVDNGYLSSISYLTMLFNYLQTQQLVPNLQESKDVDKQRLNPPEPERLSGAERDIVQTKLKKENLEERSKLYNAERKTYSTSFFFQSEQHAKKKLDQISNLFKQIVTKKRMEIILVKFLRFISLRLSERNRQFNLASGTVRNIRLPKNQLISIKNPFIPDIDYGQFFSKPENLQHIVQMHRDLFRAITGQNETQTTIMRYILQCGENIKIAAKEAGNEQ